MSVRNMVLCGMVGMGLMFLSVVPAKAQAQDGGYTVFRPDGPGPHPAVVVLSGCSGLRPSFAPKAYEQATERLRTMGFIVVWADYLGRRNKNNCFGVFHYEVAQDVVEAAAWLRLQPDVDARRITLMGWSFGGGAVLFALGKYGVDELIFTRAIAYYPYCTVTEPWTHRIPLLVLHGDADNVAPPKMCTSVLVKSAEKGDIKVITYPGALHSFDMSELPPSMSYSRGTMGYNPQAAAAAWEEVQRFLGPAK